jgi:hypothetical protein
MRPMRQMRPLIALALASACVLACKKDPSSGGPATATSASASSGASSGPSYVVTPVHVASAGPAVPLTPFVPPPPPPPAKPIVAKEGEALVTKADCAAWGDHYSKIMSGYFNEPTHATCGPKSELAEARKEMLPIFAEQARALRDDCDVQIGRRYDKADAACFAKAKSTVDWRACNARTPYFSDAIGAVPYACEKPSGEPKVPDADVEMLAVRTAPRVMRAGDCEPLATSFVDAVRARASSELSRCLGDGASQQLKTMDTALAGVREDVVKQCKGDVGGLYAGRDRLCFELAKNAKGWDACAFSTPFFRGLGEIATKMEPTYQEMCGHAVKSAN